MFGGTGGGTYLSLIAAEPVEALAARSGTTSASSLGGVFDLDHRVLGYIAAHRISQLISQSEGDHKGRRKAIARLAYLHIAGALAPGEQDGFGAARYGRLLVALVFVMQMGVLSAATPSVRECRQESGFARIDTSSAQ